jgi:hypothetical protein
MAGSIYSLGFGQLGLPWNYLKGTASRDIQSIRRDIRTYLWLLAMQ